MRGSIPRGRGVFQTLWHRARCPEQGEGGEGVLGVGVCLPTLPWCSSVGPGSNHDSFLLFVFYFSDFCCCLGCLMQIDNDFIRKRPSHFYPVIGGNHEDA